jgi:L-aminopeptidase/D-esterase-like protein
LYEKADNLYPTQARKSLILLKIAVGMRQYTKTGKYTAVLSGFASNGHVACLGNSSSTMTIEDGTIGVVIKPRPEHVTQVTLRGGNEFTPGTVQLYSTISLSKTSSICHPDYSVYTLNAGSNALNVELMNVFVSPVFIISRMNSTQVR